MDGIFSKEIYSPRDLSWILKKSLDEVRNLLEEGKILFFQIPGGHRRVTYENLLQFLKRENYPIPEALTGPRQRQRVLIVEDDPDLLEIETDLLKDESRIDVRAEDNGFTAGLQIAGWYPDLIILDFLMPGISGFDLCKKLRQNPSTADLAVLALTSLTSAEDRAAIYDSGVSDFLGKPFHSEELLRKVRVLLGLERPAA